MIVSKYNYKNRSMVILSSSDEENITEMLRNNSDSDYVKEVLNNNYLHLMNCAPYNVIISFDSVMELKSQELKHNDVVPLDKFNDDIRILVAGQFDKMNSFQIDKLSEYLADYSRKYGLRISGSIFIPSDYSNYYSNIVTDIECRAINLRNSKEPSFSTYENLLSGDLYVDNDLEIMKCVDSARTLKSLSYEYNIPLEIMQNLNPDIDENIIPVTKLIFLPNVKTIQAIKKAVNADKLSRFFHNSSINKVHGGVVSSDS